MIQIRRGCFETNSSSSHSLVISKNLSFIKRKFEFKINLNIIYGQNPFVLRSVQKKAEYVLVSLLDSINRKIPHKTNLSKTIDYIRNDKYLQLFCKLMDITVDGILSEIEFYDFKDDCMKHISDIKNQGAYYIGGMSFFEGGIDHESEFLITSNFNNKTDNEIIEILRNIIFNKNSVIQQR